MDRDLQQRWTEALRSGQYQQGTGRLRQEWPEFTLFCCLGVLADLLDPQGWWQDGDPPERHTIRTWHGSAKVLPVSTAQRIGLSAYHERILAGMNDEGKTFNAIAEYIDRAL